MHTIHKTKVLFVAGFGPIVQDQNLSEKFYVEHLGLPFTREDGGYLHTDPANTDFTPFMAGVEVSDEEVQREIGRVEDLNFIAARGA